MLKHLQKLLLFLALCVPWVTQAQCNGTQCSITIQMYDDYGDGWYDYDDDPCAIQVWQGTTLRGTATLANGSEGTATILICTDDSIRFVWTGSDDYEEISFTILNGDGSSILSLGFGSDYTNNQTIVTAASVCPTCPAPTDLTLDSLTSDGIYFSWTASGTETSWLVYVNGDYEGTATSTDYTISNPVEGSLYSITVAAFCGAGDTSLFIGPLPVIIPSGAVTSYPYSTGFETGEDAGWTFVNDANNIWTIGNATSNGGSNSLYITNDNGTSNAYSTGGTQFSYAYRAFSISDAGQYALSFDWKGYGESNYDYLRAWMAPATAQLTAGHDPEGGTNAYNYRTSTPAGWIDLGGKMNVQSSWQSKIATPNLTTGTYNLVFMWANDGSGGTQPPAAIDNIVLTQLTCAQPTQLTAVPHSYDVDLSWTAGGDETEWEIIVSDTVVEYSTSNTYTVQNLEPYTYYHFAVRAICGSGDTSFATTTGNIRTLPSCPQPTQLTVDSLTSTEIFLSWTAGGEETQWSVTINDSNFVTSDNDPLVIDNLTINTPYSISVRALCSGDDSSFATTVSTRTLAGDPISVFPYTCGFEINDDDEDEAQPWVLVNNTPNGWYVGTAANNGGTKGLYISNDNGSSNAYTNSSACVSYAYVTFFMEAGEYTFSFDWKASGESSWDFIRAAIAPFGTATPNSGWSSSSVASGYTTIDGGYMNQQSSWQTKTGTFTIANDGIYNFYFVWRNDGSGGTNPPAAIDNVMINRNTCPAPTAFHLDTIEAFQATLDWTAIGDETQWLVRAISASGAEDWQSVTSHPYIYTGLNSATDYTFELMAYCGEDDSSLVVSCAGTTPVTCPAPTDVVVTVDETTATAAFTWTDGSGSSWEFVYGDMGFSPYGADNSDQVTTTAYQVSNLDTGFYDAYVRTLCGGDDQSAWVGPINFSYGVTVMNMATSGSDTIYTCAGVIYDDGGATGSYSANCQSTLVIYPSTPGSDVIVTGVSYTEGTWDYLRIYSGVGTSGELLFDDYGVTATQSFGPFSADAITVVFHSDGSVFYDGFQINVACGAPSSCPKPTHFAVNPVQADNVVLNWGNPAGASSFELVVGAPGIVPDTVESPITTTDTFYVFNDLQSGVSYVAYVRANCSDENSNWTGPLTFVPGQYIIGTSGSASVSMCGGVIYDDGGPNGQYSNNADYQLTVYPSSADSMLTFQGSAYTESSIDYLKIYEGVGTNGNILWQTSTSSQQDVIPLTTVMSGPITLHFHTDGSVVYSGFELFVNCVAAPECAAVENLSVTSGPTSAVATWDEGFFGTYTGAMVEYREIDDSNWTALAPVTTTYVQITGLTPNTTYNLRVTTDCDGFDGDFVTANFTTGRFPCLVVDSSTIVNVVDTIGQDATTSSYFPSYSFYNYGLTQQIFTPNEIGHSGTINALAFKMSAVSQQRTYEIYMGHTSDATASQFINPADLTCVYNGGAVNMVANQWTNFTFTTPFYYNGSDNLVVFFRDITGSYVSGNAGYGFNGASGASRYVYQDSGPYTIGSTTGGTSSSFRNVLVLSTTDYGCLLSDSCAAPVAAVSDVTTTSVDVVWAPGYAETNWNVYYRQAGETAWSAPVSVTTTSYSFTNLNSGMPYEFKVEGQCNNNTLSTVVEATTLCAAITTLPYTEDFNNWGTGTLPNCWYNTGAYSTTSYSIISGSQNLTGTTGGSVYMYSSSGTSYISRIIMPAIDTNVYQASQTQVVFYVKYTSTSYGAPKFNVGVMNDANDLSTWTTVATVQHSGELNVWEPFEVPLDSYTGNGAYIGIQTEYPGTYFYCYLDNVTLEPIPTCPRPDSLMATNATSTTVDLSWHERGNATNWIIEYGPRGFTPGTGTTVTASSNPFTLTGLTAGYQGEYYVKADCGAGDVGEYSRIPCPFGTAQIPATLPYTYDFENAAEWDNWQTSSNTTIDWYRGNAVAHNSNYSMYISADQGATYIPYNNNSIVNAAVYRDVDFGSVQSSFVISFDARVGGTLSASYDGLMVFLVDPSMPTVASTSSITSPWGNVNDLYRIATVRIDTVWQNYQASFDTISGIKRVAFFWFNQNTGASYPALLEAAAIDNIHIEEATCPRPLGLTVDNVGGSTANLSWDAPAQGSYEVIYRPYPGGTQNSYAYSSTNSIVLTGLQSMTQYAVWVRKNCGTDTSLTSDGVLFTTTMCDNGVEAYNFDTTMSTTTTMYAPIGYSLYNYSYVQNIIDSAFLADAGIVGDITAFGFNVVDPSTGGDRYENMTVWMANVAESNLSSGPIIPDATDHVFYKVIDNASFSFDDNTGWMLHGFDTVFTWDGHSNVLVSVRRNNGSYSGSSTFAAHSTSEIKTRYYYQDSGPIDPTSPSASSSSTLSLSADIVLISCGAGCARPTALPATNVTYNGATVNWNSNATDFEVAVKAATDATWPAEVAVSNATSYAVSGLAPATQYQFRVRAICDATEGLISDWVEGTFTTAELPCFDPENLQAAATGYTTATLAWSADASQNMWSIHVWNSSYNEEFVATTNPFTVTGLAANTSYNAAVKALCGNGIVESEYSDTIQFTTNACARVTGVTVSNVTEHAATVSWTSTGADKYKLEYGDYNFSEGTGTTIIVENGTSYNLTGLEDDYDYSVYVKAICEEGVESDEWSVRVDFSTPEEVVGINTVDGSMSLSIYPNPASDATVIAVSGVNGEVEITIVDMNGRAVASETMSCEGDCTKRVEVSGLAQGAYFVRVSGEGINQVKKLVVK